jgi:glycoside hydrolase, family 24
MGIRAKLFAAFFAIACFGSIPLRAENPVKENQDRFSLAIECIKRFDYDK